MMEQTKNMLIGLFVVIACGLIVGIILFLEPSVGDGKQVFKIRFANINGIDVGTRVLFAGKPIGEIVAIQTIPSARAQPTNELGQVYYYQLIAHIDSHIEVYTSDEITVQTSGLLGEKSIAIIPRPSPKGVVAKRITEDMVVYGDSIDPLEGAFHQISNVTEKVEEALDKVIAWIDQNGEAVGCAVRSFDHAMDEVATAVATVNKMNVVSDVKKAIQSFTNTSDDIHNVIAQLEQDQFFGNLSVAMSHVKNASQSIESITKNLANGDGTLGKFLSDDDFYLRLTSILSKVDTTLNDVNHYGILFNLNKEWQRTRLKKITILDALDTPDSFKNYFEKEVDLINTSMSRLSMLINKAEQSQEKQRILESPLFKRDFAELMRQVDALSSNLKLYNEQLTQAQGY